jgi:hypothetical protein
MSGQLRDPLDDAIDRVASRMVSVHDDTGAARRIISSLPSRDQRRWSVSALSFQAAAVAVVALVIVYGRSFNPGEPAHSDSRRAPAEVQQPAPLRGVDAVPAVAPTQVERAAVSRRRSLPQPTDTQPVFGLDAIEAPEQLTIPSLVATFPLEPIEAASVAPITIDDLPLSSDGASPF